MATVDERLTRLEASNRRWRVAALGLGLALLAGAGDDTVRARRLVIEDEKRNPRIVLETVESSPRLEMTDERGRKRVWLGASGEGANLMLNGPSGKASVTVDALPGIQGVWVYDKSGAIVGRVPQ